MQRAHREGAGRRQDSWREDTAADLSGCGGSACSECVACIGGGGDGPSVALA